jgi:hypothetical protein
MAVKKTTRGNHIGRVGFYEIRFHPNKSGSKGGLKFCLYRGKKLVEKELKNKESAIEKGLELLGEKYCKTYNL